MAIDVGEFNKVIQRDAGLIRCATCASITVRSAIGSVSTAWRYFAASEPSPHGIA